MNPGARQPVGCLAIFLVFGLVALAANAVGCGPSSSDGSAVPVVIARR